MKVLRDFDLFINPNDVDDVSFYDVIDFHCLSPCSYVHYIYFITINGEIDSKPIPIQFEYLKNIIYDDCLIIAYNHCDDICLEVDLIV